MRTYMKNLVLASAVLLAMAACSSDDDGSDLECYTNFTDDTAKLFFSYKDYSLDEIATHYSDEDGEYSSVVKKYTFASSADAEKKCAALAAEYAGAMNHYECDGNMVIERYARLDTRDEIRESDEYLCNYLYEMDRNGMLDSLYEANTSK